MVRLMAVVAAASALGVIGRLSDGWPHGLRVLFVLGSPWVVVAVLVGALWMRPTRGALAGALALGWSVVVYYVMMAGIEGRATPLYAVAMILGWGGLAVIVGAVFGAAGAALRGGPSAAAAAALIGGALAGEAVLFLALGSAESELLAGQLLAGLAVAIGFAPPARRTRLLALTACAATGTFVVDAAARMVMRRYGWGG